MLPISKSFDLFSSFFEDPFFENSGKLTKREHSIMKTDIKEKDGKYIISVDLPGYEKEEIKLELENGYLSIMAKKDEEKEEDTEGYIRRERYTGSCSRSFYVGENVSYENVKAKYKNGILQISVPKEDDKLETKKLIDID